MHWARFLRRQPAVYWAAGVGLLVATFAAAGVLTNVASGLRAVVARADLAAGHVITEGDVARQDVPRTTVPGSPLLPLEAVVGRTVRADILAGEVVVEARLLSDGRSGPGGLLGPGAAGVAVPLGRASPPLHVGVGVLVLTATSQSAVVPTSAGAGPSAPVAGTVIALDNAVATVSVAAADAARLATPLAHGEVTLALRGPSP